ncbi:hypothetical protein DOY81_002661 [Sarcophaga bullata]|nr:hypothetical protein DOY81_002661 [Sarcophaga bullata]
MSTAFSKFFKEHIEPRNCQNLLHTEDSCLKHVTKDCLPYFISNAKYFAPVCMLPILVDLRNINKKKLRKTLEYYLGCSVIGWLVGYSINVFMCTMRNIVGRFHFYTLTFTPGILGGSLTYLGPARVCNLFEITVFQCTIESFFIMRRNFISRAISDSRVLQTGLFMLCSAIIMFGKQIYNTKGFWILTPNPRLTPSENTEDQKCKLHPQKTCQQYLFDGMSKYFILGLTMDLIKMLTRKKITSQAQTKFMGKLRNFHIHSMPLFTGYIGIYRFMHCWLNNKGFYPDLCNHILSSFLAGSIFFYYPQATLLSYALVQAIRSLWSIFEATNQDTKNKILKFILKIPCGRLLYPVCLGYLLNLSALQPKYISPLTVTVVNNIANNYPKQIGNEIDNIKKQYKL